MKNKIIILFVVGILALTVFSILPFSQGLNVQKPLDACSYEDIVEMVQEIDEDDCKTYLYNLLSFGPRYTGSINCTMAAGYLFSEFKEMGYDVEFHEWDMHGFNSLNVVATKPGINSPGDAVFIMSAHYDCTPGSLGADDDASGVAAMLAAAEVMSQYSFNHTIRFIAFSGEEVGTYGSFCYARDAYNNGENIVGVLNADMIGYANTTEGGKIIRFFHVDRARWLADFASDVGEKYMDLIDMSVEILPNYKGSDHQGFLDYGYDAVWIAHHDGYQWANSPEDTPDHLNFTYEVKAAKFLCACLAELANEPIDIQVILRSPYEGYFIFRGKPIFPVYFTKYWFLGLRGTTIIFGKNAVASVDVISEEEIEKVVFCLDDDFVFWDYEPPYEWTIKARYNYPLTGFHILKVYAYSESGKFASDEMDLRTFIRK